MKKIFLFLGLFGYFTTYNAQSQNDAEKKLLEKVKRFQDLTKIVSPPPSCGDKNILSDLRKNIRIILPRKSALPLDLHYEFSIHNPKLFMYQDNRKSALCKATFIMTSPVEMKQEITYTIAKHKNGEILAIPRNL